MLCVMHACYGGVYPGSLVHGFDADRFLRWMRSHPCSVPASCHAMTEVPAAAVVLRQAIRFGLRSGSSDRPQGAAPSQVVREPGQTSIRYNSDRLCQRTVMS